MTLASVLYMLLGAALVTSGVLVSALADRVRGLRASREQPLARERAAREKSAPQRAAIAVVEEPELVRATPAPTKARAVRPEVRPEPKPSANTDGGEDVIAALVAAGYKRPIATEATWACGAGERASIEGWTAAALRRCARGAMS